MEDDLNIVNMSNIKFKSPDEISNKINKESKSQKKWSRQEDQLLLTLVDEYKNSKIKWPKISISIVTKTTRQCYSRYAQINPKFNKGMWLKKEDDELLKNISKYGRKWSLLASLMKTRSNKQIRDRYLNCLDQRLSKISFTKEEDIQIIQLVSKYGSNWSQIAKEIQGRTGDNIKNRYNWSIRQTLKDPIDLKIISNFYYIN